MTTEVPHEFSQELHRQINELAKELCALPKFKIFKSQLWEKITTISIQYLRNLFPNDFDAIYKTNKEFSSSQYDYFDIYDEIFTDIYTYYALQTDKYVPISSCIEHYISAFANGKDEKNVKLNLSNFTEKYNSFFGDYLFPALSTIDVIRYNSQSPKKVDSIHKMFSQPILAFMNNIGSKKWIQPEDALYALQHAVEHVHDIIDPNRNNNLTFYYIDRFWGINTLSQIYDLLSKQLPYSYHQQSPDYTRINIEKYLWCLYYPYASQRKTALTEATEHMNNLKNIKTLEKNPALALMGWNPQEICNNILQTKLIVTITNILFNKLCESHQKATMLELLERHLQTTSKEHDDYQILHQAFDNINRRIKTLTTKGFSSPMICEEYLTLRQGINTINGLTLYAPGFIRPIFSEDFTDIEVRYMRDTLSAFYTKRSYPDYLNSFYF